MFRQATFLVFVWTQGHVLPTCIPCPCFDPKKCSTNASASIPARGELYQLPYLPCPTIVSTSIKMRGDLYCHSSARRALSVQLPYLPCPTNISTSISNARQTLLDLLPYLPCPTNVPILPFQCEAGSTSCPTSLVLLPF